MTKSKRIHAASASVILGVSLLACSGAGGEAGLRPTDAAAAQTQEGAPPPESNVPDAAPQGPHTPGGDPRDPNVPGELPTCLGNSLPIVMTAGPHANIPIGAAPSPHIASFLVDYATTGTTVDLSKLGVPGPATTHCDPSQLGQFCTFEDFDFFGLWGQVSLVTSTASILGTDFLAHGIYTLDYKKQRMLSAPKDACSDFSLQAAGLVALPTTGFFADDVTRLRQQHDINDAVPPGLQVANVPMVPAAIADTPAIVQLDTGFDDNVVPHSINVNVAFFGAINVVAPGALIRNAAKDVSLSTCAGVSEPVEAYELAPGRTFDLLDDNKASVRSWPGVTVYVKRTPAEAMRCGGIGTWSAPAAQIGTSFFADAGVLVFDPFTSRVWLSR